MREFFLSWNKTRVRNLLSIGFVLALSPFQESCKRREYNQDAAVKKLVALPDFSERDGSLFISDDNLEFAFNKVEPADHERSYSLAMKDLKQALAKDKITDISDDALRGAATKLRDREMADTIVAHLDLQSRKSEKEPWDLAKGKYLKKIVSPELKDAFNGKGQYGLDGVSIEGGLLRGIYLNTMYDPESFARLAVALPESVDGLRIIHAGHDFIGFPDVRKILKLIPFRHLTVDGDTPLAGDYEYGDFIEFLRSVEAMSVETLHVHPLNEILLSEIVNEDATLIHRKLRHLSFTVPEGITFQYNESGAGIQAMSQLPNGMGPSLELIQNALQYFPSLTRLTMIAQWAQKPGSIETFQKYFKTFDVAQLKGLVVEFKDYRGNVVNETKF